MSTVRPFLPPHTAEYLPFAKAAGFFLGTFVLEDVAALGAGALLADGGISWPAAFIACFLGIWMGDTGLYALARYAGRGWFERSSFQRYAARVAESEQRFEKRGAAILIFSRLIPGARLPTYLAAGFLRVPLSKFLMITGVAACVWTMTILFLTETFGSRLSVWLGVYKQAGLVLLLVCVVFVMAMRWLPRIINKFDGACVSVWLGRWRHWEFWPVWAFYPPVGLYYFWLSLKYRGVTLPTVANPGILSGGMVGESKMATLKDLFATSSEFTAQAELITGETASARLLSLEEIRSRLDIGFPFILKPDIGQRGMGVKLIRSQGQAEAYLRQSNSSLVIQRYAPGPREVGIFYYRFPHESRGRIFGITKKEFPIVIGDGSSTISELIRHDARGRFIADKYIQRFKTRIDEILPMGQTLKLVEAGNHAQGCIFQDGRLLCTPELEARIDSISQKLNGFFIGRYDIRYESEEELSSGRDFSIIELNGASSEATHIYDARTTLWSAYQTLFRQWEMVFEIGAANRNRGFVPMTPFQFWKHWRKFSRAAVNYPAAD